MYLRPTYAENYIIEIKNRLTSFAYAGTEITLKKRKYKGNIIVEIELLGLLRKKE